MQVLGLALEPLDEVADLNLGRAWRAWRTLLLREPSGLQEIISSPRLTPRGDRGHLDYCGTHPCNS